MIKYTKLWLISLISATLLISGCGEAKKEKPEGNRETKATAQKSSQASRESPSQAATKPPENIKLPVWFVNGSRDKWIFHIEGHEAVELAPYAMREVDAVLQGTTITVKDSKGHTAHKIKADIQKGKFNIVNPGNLGKFASVNQAYEFHGKQQITIRSDGTRTTKNLSADGTLVRSKRFQAKPLDGELISIDCDLNFDERLPEITKNLKTRKKIFRAYSDTPTVTEVNYALQNQNAYLVDAHRPALDKMKNEESAEISAAYHKLMQIHPEGNVLSSIQSIPFHMKFIMANINTIDEKNAMSIVFNLNTKSYLIEDIVKMNELLIPSKDMHLRQNNFKLMGRLLRLDKKGLIAPLMRKAYVAEKDKTVKAYFDNMFSSFGYHHGDGQIAMDALVKPFSLPLTKQIWNIAYVQPQDKFTECVETINAAYGKMSEEEKLILYSVMDTRHVFNRREKELSREKYTQKMRAFVRLVKNGLAAKDLKIKIHALQIGLNNNMKFTWDKVLAAEKNPTHRAEMKTVIEKLTK